MTRQYIGARYVPKFFDNQTTGDSSWLQGVSYEALTIVTYNGNSYTSKKPVPAGIGAPNLNRAYWAETGNFNQQLEEVSYNVTQTMKLDNYTTPEYEGYTSGDVSPYLSTTKPILLDGDYVIENNVNITSIITGKKLTLQANLILKTGAQLVGCEIVCDGGSIVIDGEKINITNNQITCTADHDNIAILINDAEGLNITGNYLVSDVDDLSTQNNIGIKYIQGAKRFMNSTITLNTIRKFAKSIFCDITDTTRAVYNAGNRIINNTIVSAYNGIDINCCDHYKICDNIIDYCESPVKLVSPNGLRLENNYIFTPTDNKNCIDIEKGTTFCEHIIIAQNYIWTQAEHKDTTKGIYTHGNSLNGLLIKNNMIRYVGEAVYVDNVVNDLVINDNQFTYAAKGIKISDTSVGTITHNYFTSSVSTLYDIALGAVIDYNYCSTTSFQTGTIGIGEVKDFQININSPTSNPTIICTVFNQSNPERYAFSALSTSRSSATIRVRNTSAEYGLPNTEIRVAVIA